MSTIQCDDPDVVLYELTKALEMRDIQCERKGWAHIIFTLMVLKVGSWWNILLFQKCDISSVLWLWLHIQTRTLLTGNFDTKISLLCLHLILILPFGNSFMMLFPAILEFVAESNRLHRNSSGVVLSNWKYVTYRHLRDKPRRRTSSPYYEAVRKNPVHSQRWASRKQVR